MEAFLMQFILAAHAQYIARELNPVRALGQTVFWGMEDAEEGGDPLVRADLAWGEKGAYDAGVHAHEKWVAEVEEEAAADEYWGCVGDMKTPYC